MRTALSFPRVHAPKSNIEGVYNSVTCLTVVNSQKGQHFRTIGKADADAKIHLLPEEALYLLERGNLDMSWPEQNENLGDGIPFSLQSACVTLVGQLGLTLERYMVYAGLKRSGYIVQRSPCWDPGDFNFNVDPKTNSSRARPTSIFSWIYYLLLGGSGRKTSPFDSLVAVGLYKNYGTRSVVVF